MGVRRSRQVPVVAAVAVAVALPLAAVSLGAGPASPSVTPVVGRVTTPSTVIVVDARRRLGGASTSLFGINHHYQHDGLGAWDPVADRPEPLLVARTLRVGAGALRFPGGTQANLWRWERSVGDARGCQIDSKPDGGSFAAFRRGMSFGPDEYMRLLRAVRADPIVMMPGAISTPSEAADFVEYLNAPSGAGNPNGGVDWADVRAANGHAAPYGVRRWEIGNEPYLRHERYWRSQRDGVAARQYALGGAVTRDREALGKACSHPVGGVLSNGRPGQAFELLYPPARRGSVEVLVAGHPWTVVDDLAAQGPRAHVVTVDPGEGVVQFGDGVHGAVPPTGARVRATYRSVHAGYFAFAAAMKSVDPRIKVCSTWSRPGFVQAAGGRSYDCVTDHLGTVLLPRRWSSRLMGHDRMMLALERRLVDYRTRRARLPHSVPLWVTESALLGGDHDRWPSFQSSASHSAYMASLWADWMRMRVPYALSDDLLWSDRAVLGEPPVFTYTANAVTREAVRPMFRRGGAVLSSGVLRNPWRPVPRTSDGYRALDVVATRTPTGDVLVLVVNRLPTRAVTARLSVRGFRGSGRGAVRRVVAPDFDAWNPPGARPQVRLSISYRPIAPASSVHRFAPASTTLLVLRHR